MENNTTEQPSLPLISQSDFNRFLKEKQIDVNEKSETLFETFLVFQQFIKCINNHISIDKQCDVNKDNESHQKEICVDDQVKESKQEHEIEMDNMNINQISDHLIIGSEYFPQQPESKVNDDLHDEPYQTDKNNDGINTQISIENQYDNKKTNEGYDVKATTYRNYDDIPIKSSNVNFVELVEKNLAELQYQPDPNREQSCEKVRRNKNKYKTGQPGRIVKMKLPVTKTQSLIKTEHKKHINSGTKYNKSESLNEYEKKNVIKEELKDEDEEKPSVLPIFIHEEEYKNQEEKKDSDNHEEIMKIEDEIDDNQKVKEEIEIIPDDNQYNYNENNEEIKVNERIIEYDETKKDNDDEDDLEDVGNEKALIATDHLNNNKVFSYRSDSLNIVIPVNEYYGENINENKDQDKHLNNVSINHSESDSDVIINNYDDEDDDSIDIQKEDNKPPIQTTKSANINKIISPTVETKEIHKNKQTSSKLNETQRIIELEREVQRLKEENKISSKVKQEYQQLKESLKRERDDFNNLKRRELYEIEKKKKEEMAIIDKLKGQSMSYPHTPTQKQIGNSQQNQQALIIQSKKDKEQIDQLQNKLKKYQEDQKIKDNNTQLYIEKLKKQLQESNTRIMELIRLTKDKGSKNLQNRTTSLQNSNNNTQSNIRTAKGNSIDKEKISSNKLVSPKQTPEAKTKHKIKTSLKKDNKNETNIYNIKPVNVAQNNNDIYQLKYPKKYDLTSNDIVILNDKAPDGKMVKIYSNQMKEIVFPSGVIKRVFSDGYQVIFFNNNDVKQIYPNGQTVYYYSESKVTQTVFPNNLHVYLLANGQIEKHYPNGVKETTKLIQRNQGHLRNNKDITDNQLTQQYLETLNLQIDTQHNDIIKIQKSEDGSEMFEFEYN